MRYFSALRFHNSILPLPAEQSKRVYATHSAYSNLAHQLVNQLVNAAVQGELFRPSGECRICPRLGDIPIIFRKCSGLVPAMEPSSTTCFSPAAFAASICRAWPFQSTYVHKHTMLTKSENADKLRRGAYTTKIPGTERERCQCSLFFTPYVRVEHSHLLRHLALIVVELRLGLVQPCPSEHFAEHYREEGEVVELGYSTGADDHRVAALAYLVRSIITKRALVMVGVTEATHTHSTYPP